MGKVSGVVFLIWSECIWVWCEGTKLVLSKEQRCGRDGAMDPLRGRGTQRAIEGSQPQCLNEFPISISSSATIGIPDLCS